LNGLGIVSAFTAESRLLGAPIRRDQALASLADGTLLVVSGMGRAAAEQGALRLVAAGARALMSWGLAGGLDPALAAGTVLLPNEVVSTEDEVLPTAREWRERLSGAVAPLCTVCAGRLLTCRQPLASPADKVIAFRQSAAAAVDLESFVVATVAARHGLPFLAVRAIADTALDGLPRSLLAVAAGASDVRMGRLLGALVRAPAELPGFIRLVRRYSTASRALRFVARSGALAAFELRCPERPG
jgi:adenosylhomocysteine nucleosidase